MLNRDIFIGIQEEFNSILDKLIKLIKPLYEIGKSGDDWGRPSLNHLKKTVEWNLVPLTQDCSKNPWYKE